MCLLASVLCSFRGPLVVLPFLLDLAQIRRPVSQNEGIAVGGMNGFSALDAAAIERITVKTDLTGLGMM